MFKSTKRFPRLEKYTVKIFDTSRVVKKSKIPPHRHITGYRIIKIYNYKSNSNKYYTYCYPLFEGNEKSNDTLRNRRIYWLVTYILPIKLLQTTYSRKYYLRYVYF